MQAKDIPERPVLAFIDQIARQNASASAFPGYWNSVANAMPDDTPEKVALAKMGSLIKRGLVDGCTCGCRGDFLLTPKGREAIKEVGG